MEIQQSPLDTEEMCVKDKIQADFQSVNLDQDMQCVSEDREILLSTMEKGLRRVSDIVHNITVFSRLESDQKDRCDINDCIRTSYKLLHRQLNDNIVLSLEQQDLPYIDINMGKITQILCNLVVNASESIENSGHIRVYTKVNANNIEVCVSDNGCGINPSALMKIFDPFYTTKKDGQGMGLGLAISYDIAKDHGGHLRVSSEENVGSVFTLSLPFSRALLH